MLLPRTRVNKSWPLESKEPDPPSKAETRDLDVVARNAFWEEMKNVPDYSCAFCPAWRPSMGLFYGAPSPRQPPFAPFSEPEQALG